VQRVALTARPFVSVLCRPLDFLSAHGHEDPTAQIIRSRSYARNAPLRSYRAERERLRERPVLNPATAPAGTMRNRLFRVVVTHGGPLTQGASTVHVPCRPHL